MTHKHHIVPRHKGGTDDPSNLIELTVEEHAQAHLELFLSEGRWQDEIAYKALSGLIDKEEIVRKIQHNVGKINGAKNRANGHMKRIQPLGSQSGAKLGAEACRDKGANSFFDPILRKVAQRSGGKKGGKVNGTQRLASCLSCRKSGQVTVMNRWHFEKCRL